MSRLDLIQFLIGLIVIFSPFGIIPVYGGYVSGLPVKTQHRLAWRVSLNVLAVFVVCAAAGQLLLRALGITLPALTMTGGTILLLSSIPMVMRGHVAREESLENRDHEAVSREIVIVPLTFPLAVGAAQISYIITYFGQAVTVRDRLALAGMLMLAWLVIWLSLYMSGPLARLLGHRGNDILVRISGIILMSLAFMLVSRGLAGLIPFPNY